MIIEMTNWVVICAVNCTERDRLWNVGAWEATNSYRCVSLNFVCYRTRMVQHMNTQMLYIAHWHLVLSWISVLVALIIFDLFCVCSCESQNSISLALVMNEKKSSSDLNHLQPNVCLILQFHFRHTMFRFFLAKNQLNFESLQAHTLPFDSIKSHN